MFYSLLKETLKVSVMICVSVVMPVALVSGMRVLGCDHTHTTSTG